MKIKSDLWFVRRKVKTKSEVCKMASKLISILVLLITVQVLCTSAKLRCVPTKDLYGVLSSPKVIRDEIKSQEGSLEPTDPNKQKFDYRLENHRV